MPVSSGTPVQKLLLVERSLHPDGGAALSAASVSKFPLMIPRAAPDAVLINRQKATARIGPCHSKLGFMNGVFNGLVCDPREAGKPVGFMVERVRGDFSINPELVLNGRNMIGILYGPSTRM